MKMENVPTDRLSIPVDPDGVIIVKTPSEFYQTLLNKINSAKHRIFLSSLYLGDGVLENALVDALQLRLDEDNGLDVTVLLDFLRGTRGENAGKSSTSLLKRIASKAKVFLYHTPQLRGFTRYLLGERSNEIVGLQHMKLYIFDDTVLISGANLSDSYFTNRQDRYVMIEKASKLADYFLISAVGSCSFVLDGEGRTRLAEGAPAHPYTGNAQTYCSGLRERLEKVAEKAKANHSNKISRCEGDTVVVPLLQMGNFGIHEEYDLLRQWLGAKDDHLDLTIASGYLNMTTEYERLILEEGNYALRILMAAPEANGFAGASGFSKHVPAMYSSIEASFYQAMQRNPNRQAALLEWSRPGWSFHAKGMWADYGSRMDTLIGSSNYGYRSLERDLEAQILLSTNNADLMQRLREERNALLECSSVVDASVLRRADHHVPALVKFFARFIRNFF